MTLDDQIKELPESLAEALGKDLSEPDSKGNSRDCMYQRVDIQTRGGINQMTLLQTNTIWEKPEQNFAEQPGRFKIGDPHLQVLDLVSNGGLLKKRQLYLERPEHTVFDLVLQNCRGDLLHICCR